MESCGSGSITLQGRPLPRFTGQPSENRSKKVLLFALPIILGLGFLAMAGTGLCSLATGQGWWAAGSFSHISQIHALMMLTAGSIGGILFLLPVIVGAIRTIQYKPFALPPHEKPIFGQEAYKMLDVEVIGDIPEMPEIDWRAEDPQFPGQTIRDTRVLLLVPRQVKIKGKVHDLTLNLLKCFPKIEGEENIAPYSKDFELNYGVRKLKESYWVEILKQPIPDTLNLGFEQQKTYLQEIGCSPPQALEIALCCLLFRAQHNYYLFAETFTCCERKPNSHHAILAGNFSTNGVAIMTGSNSLSGYGVAGVIRHSELNKLSK